MFRIPATQPLALASMLALATAGSALAQGQARYADYEVLAPGTVLKAQLNQRLTSADARPGDRFTATVRPKEDRSGLPEGTRVEGVVREAKPAAKDKAGVLDVDFTLLRYPNGRTQSIQGSLTALDSKSVQRNESGRLVSIREKKNERMKFLGYGAGAGAVIGALTGHNAIKSALLGAAGGYLYGQVKKDNDEGRYRDVNLKEGTEFGVRLDQRLAFTPVSYGRVNGYGEPVGQRVGQMDGRGRGTANRAYPDGVAVMMDDREVRFGAARPFRQGRALLVPMAPVLQSAGVPYRYDSKLRQVTVDGPAGRARLTLGSTVAWASSGRVTMDAPARYVGNTLYVPANFLELATGRRAEWDDGTQTLLFLSREEDRSPYGGQGMGL